AVKQHLQPLLRAHLEMRLALRADKKVLFQILSKSDGPAILALRPQPFRADAALLRRGRLGNCFLVSFKPSHFAVFSFCCHGSHLAQPVAIHLTQDKSGPLFPFHFTNGRAPLLAAPLFNSLYHAARECLSCKDASLPSSPLPGLPALPASDARFVRCKSRVLA